MKSPIQQRVHFIKEVALPSLTFQSKPHCGQCDIWLEGELAKEVVFIHVFVITFEQAHFGMFSGLLVFFFFCEASILYNFFCSKIAPIFLCFA